MKRRWALALARPYVRRALARSFEGVYVDGLAAARAACAAGPVLFCANHQSFWDGFVVVAVDEALGSDGYCVMDELNLARLSFFRPLGALPLSLVEPRRALAQLNDVATLLDRPGRAAWIFPQGRQRPAWHRPLAFRRGFTRVVEKSGCAVVPVSILITWREAPEPALLVRLHAPLQPTTSARDLAAGVEGAVAAGLDALDAAAVEGVVPPLLVRGTGRPPQTSTATKLLARLTGTP